ncbi:hypothetical protein ACFUCV_04470 [Specibacter sp. NPDC057265]|uniref:hypothetical protein n=1 Tax=Specibacter sp. NPDC057265 TaxID=3346075 RepID=UPI003630D23F
MSPIYLLPLCVGVFWLLHACLRLLGHKTARYTAWLLLAGLPVMAIAFFLSSMAAEEPDPSVLLGDGFLPMLFAMECLFLWSVAGLAETILFLISSSRRDKSTLKETVGLDRP